MKLKFRLIILLLIIASFGYAQNHESSEEKIEQFEQKEKFNPGEFIVDEVLDHYEWHIMEIDNKEISIPLPVIVYSKERSKLYAFSSKKLRHGHHYKNFFIAEEGKYKGKVVEQLSNGDIVRPIDISITKNVLAIWISIALLFWIFLSMAKKYKEKPLSAPKGFQALLEPIVLFVRDDIAKAAIGEDKYEKYTPFLLSVFFFIFLNNLLGLLPTFPGGANVTGNLAVTGVLAFFTFVITTFSGTKHYWKHIFWNPDVPWWLKVPLPLMPLVELTGVITKPTVLMIRLFANILGGHIVRVTFISLIFIFAAFGAAAAYGVSVISIFFVVFVTFLEMLVAFIQAYVFTLLSAIYFGMATEEGH